ncbi:hypothetical protein WCX49_13105 [Sulfurimonas sp. HSL-1656]|jgi:hypothetical protein|uniref:LPXTG cell wall anchor domain-containing protein n=1 Tax=Sulfurimonas diazotrophicus TaxID=3131939 RepID=A0ABZ3H973_9BACT|nr:hypothetical protein [Sulfurimonas sp. HSL-3221]UFS62512.1 hypothetical protein LOH54_12815 [Sulfurimonas sp. HSL-3221]
MTGLDIVQIVFLIGVVLVGLGGIVWVVKNEKK